MNPSTMNASSTMNRLHAPHPNTDRTDRTPRGSKDASREIVAEAHDAIAKDGGASRAREQTQTQTQKQRNATVFEALREGKSLRAIGRMLGVSGERVRQIISKSPALRAAQEETLRALAELRIPGRAPAAQPPRERKAQTLDAMDARAAILLDGILAGHDMDGLGALIQRSAHTASRLVFSRPALREAWIQQEGVGASFSRRGKGPLPKAASSVALRAQTLVEGVSQGKPIKDIATEIGVSANYLSHLIASDEALRSRIERARRERAEAMARACAQTILDGVRQGHSETRVARDAGLTFGGFRRMISDHAFLRNAIDAAQAAGAEVRAQVVRAQAEAAAARAQIQLEEAHAAALKRGASTDMKPPRGRPTLSAAVIEARIQGVEKGLRDGKKVPQIAQELDLSVATVRVTIHAHLRALDARLRDERRQRRVADRVL